jgi:hypothetical protein
MISDISSIDNQVSLSNDNENSVNIDPDIEEIQKLSRESTFEIQKIGEMLPREKQESFFRKIKESFLHSLIRFISDTAKIIKSSSDKKNESVRDKIAETLKNLETLKRRSQFLSAVDMNNSKELRETLYWMSAQGKEEEYEILTYCREKVSIKCSQEIQELFVQTLKAIEERLELPASSNVGESHKGALSKTSGDVSDAEKTEHLRRFAFPLKSGERLTALRWMNEQGGRDEYKTLLKYKDEILGDSSPNGRIAKSLFESALQRIGDRLWKENSEAASGDAPDAKLRHEIMELLDELYTPQGRIDWLNSPHYRCDGKTPQEMIDEGNARWVLNILGALAEGNHL